MFLKVLENMLLKYFEDKKIDISEYGLIHKKTKNIYIIYTLVSLMNENVFICR